MQIGDVTAVSDGRPMVIRHMDYTDEGVYRIAWPEGHTTLTVLQNPKFSVLMEFSAEALSDDYYREALLDAASSLDAYMDYHIAVLLRVHQTAKDHARTLITSASKQAERRIGCFLACEAMLRGQPPEYVGNKIVEMRNSVVHKGYIPTRAEAFTYITGILDFIIPRYRELCSQYQKAMTELFFEKISCLPPATTPRHSHAACAWRTIIDHLTFKQNGDASTLEEYMSQLKLRKSQP